MIETLTVPYADAIRAFGEYRAAVRRRYTAEDDALACAYGALTRGQRVLALPDVMRAAGRDALGRPRLAISWAHREWVYCRAEPNGAIRFAATEWVPRRSRRISLSAGTLPALREAVEARARVPLIPPRFRPDAPHRYYVLWEADWERAPRDPYLLRHLGGPFYAVLAQWNLTPLERAILETRRSP